MEMNDKIKYTHTYAHARTKFKHHGNAELMARITYNYLRSIGYTHEEAEQMGADIFDDQLDHGDELCERNQWKEILDIVNSW